MKTGRVKPDSGLNLRVKPNGEKTGVLKHNERFEIIDEVSYYRIRTGDGKLGYVHGDYVETMAAPSVSEPAANPTWSGDFKLTSFTHPRFIGNEVKIDLDFTPALSKVAEFAEACAVQVWVTSSIRSLNNQINGAIVAPATNSCHHVGHAIDMNVMHQGILYNSDRLRISAHHDLPEPVLDFLNHIRATD